jgi:hypothetical protein
MLSRKDIFFKSGLPFVWQVLQCILFEYFSSKASLGHSFIIYKFPSQQSAGFSVQLVLYWRLTMRNQRSYAVSNVKSIKSAKN